MSVGQLLVSLVAVAAVAGVGACSSADTSSVPASHVRHAEEVLAGLTTNADADAFQLDLVARTEIAIAVCMARADLVYRLKDPRSLVDVTSDTDFASAGYARDYGFGVTSAASFATTPDPNRTYRESLDSKGRQRFDARLALCADTAGQRARRETGLLDAEKLYARTDAAVHADSQYRSAETSWRRCAAHAGYPAQSRLELIKQFADRRDQLLRRVGAQSTPDVETRRLAVGERAAATATFACSQSLDRMYMRRYRALR